jgi:hypothetical protein
MEHRVGIEHGVSVRALEGDRRAGRAALAEDVDHLTHERGQVDALALEMRDLCEGKHPLDEAAAVLSSLASARTISRMMTASRSSID